MCHTEQMYCVRSVCCRNTSTTNSHAGTILCCHLVNTTSCSTVILCSDAEVFPWTPDPGNLLDRLSSCTYLHTLALLVSSYILRIFKYNCHGHFLCSSWLPYGLLICSDGHCHWFPFISLTCFCSWWLLLCSLISFVMLSCYVLFVGQMSREYGLFSSCFIMASVHLHMQYYDAWTFA